MILLEGELVLVIPKDLEEHVPRLHRLPHLLLPQIHARTARHLPPDPCPRTARPLPPDPCPPTPCPHESLFRHLPLPLFVRHILPQSLVLLHLYLHLHVLEQVESVSEFDRFNDVLLAVEQGEELQILEGTGHSGGDRDREGR